MATAGIVGLAPGAWDPNVQLFVPSLYKQGAIKKNVFSMYIDQNATSKIQIGGFDEEKYAIEPLKWYPLSEPFYWKVNFGNVTIGDFKLNPTVNVIMADTGTSLNMISNDDFNAIYDGIFKGKYECFVSSSSLTACECTEEQHKEIPDIHFQINGDDFVIPRDSWYERQPSKGLCYIKFMHGPSHNSWILGLNFFNSYYTVFDYENQALGFAKSKMFGHSTPMGFIQASSSSFITHNIGKVFGVEDVNADLGMTYILGFLIITATLCSICQVLRQEKTVVTATEVVEENEDELKRKQFEVCEQAFIRAQL